MKRTEAKRQSIIEKVADHLLAHGLHKASLRPLAAAVGTSDRMLLHYFASKEELLNAALIEVTGRLVGLLRGAIADPMPFPRLIPQAVKRIQSPLIRPYLRIWMELVAQAADGDKSSGTIARKICDVFLGWTAQALKVEREAERLPTASLAFATIEGLVLLDALEDSEHIQQALQGIKIRG